MNKQDVQKFAEYNGIFGDQLTVTLSIVIFYGFLSGNNPIFGCLVYLLANAISIWAGYHIRDMGERGQEYNRRYHKWCVLLLNSTAGGSVLWYAYIQQQFPIIPIGTLAVCSILYLLSYITGLIKPHSLLARFRSVVMRILISITIVAMITPIGSVIVSILCIPIMVMAWRHLKKDQEAFDWEFR